MRFVELGRPPPPRRRAQPASVRSVQRFDCPKLIMFPLGSAKANSRMPCSSSTGAVTRNTRTTNVLCSCSTAGTLT